MRLEILYEDDDMIVINKPPGLLVIPDRFNPALSSLNKLLEQQIKAPVWVVHRLDKETSGVVCFAKNEKTHKHLSLQFQNQETEKYYTGLIIGKIIPEEGSITTPITEHPTIAGKMVTAKKGKASHTDYKTLQQWLLYALVEMQLHTGRTHQIRVHLQSVGHPLICDPLYGDGKPFFLSQIKKKYRLSEKEEEERPLLNRLALHASKLKVKKLNSEILTVESPLPKDIAACVNQLNKWSL